MYTLSLMQIINFCAFAHRFYKQLNGQKLDMEKLLHFAQIVIYSTLRIHFDRPYLS